VKQVAVPAGFSEKVELGERYEIAPATRLPEFDSGLAEAYAATDRNDPGRKLFALMAPGHLACRGLALATQRPPVGTQMLWPQASGIVDWPVGSDGSDILWGRRPAFVCQQPGGERLMKLTPGKAPVFGREEGALPQFSEANLVKHVLQPAVLMLRELVLMSAPHRAINPANMFYQSGKSGEVMFGDCLASPPGYQQPAAFETIENATALPIGRGLGTIADDMYALGATALMLYLGRNPAGHLSDEQLVHAKINGGSFSALAGGDKLPPGIAELLRGLLCDKVADRWTIKQLEGWLQGQHYNPVLPGVPRRASRPIRFKNTDYLSQPALAQAMARDWAGGIEIITGPDFDNWFKRSFGDEKAGEKMNRIAGLAAHHGPSAAIRDRMLSRYIVMMGVSLPLAYKDIVSNLTGLGTLLAHHFERSDQVQQVGELLQARLPQVWLEEQHSLTPEQMQFRRALDQVEKVIARPGLGYGMERVLYELAKGTPCRSALVADYYVTDLKDLLPAIDAAIGGAGPGTLPMDRHIAAFVAANMKRAIDNELAPLASRTDEIAYRVAILRLIAILQRTFPNQDLPRLSAALVEMLQPAIAAFHNNEIRQHAADEMARHAADCRFDEMLLLLDPEGPLRKGDTNAFANAMQEYAELERERAWLRNGGLTEVSRVRAAAQRAAAVTATLVASAGVTGYGIYTIMF
jgi:hypothetical protein